MVFAQVKLQLVVGEDGHITKAINGDTKKIAKRVEISLVSRILAHDSEPRFVKLGEKLEALRLKHEQGLITSMEFLKSLLELAKEAAEAEREVVPENEMDKGKAALTELFNSVTML